MATTLKKCLKLHKLFLAEVARSAKLEPEGSQVLSSLANVSQRVMGVLSYSRNTQALLLQKHFLALEKSRGFLTDILRDYQDLLRHLRSFSNECATLVDDALIEGGSAATVADEMAAVTFPLQLQEWMETVLAMFEHEVLRKTRLVADLEYSDTGRLSAAAKQWSAKGAVGNIDHDYVETGLQLPQAKSSSAQQSADSESDSSRSKTKKKKKNKAKK
ncbi:hypothetical protein PHYSODRAFT_310586 [Phytophthora sojae]|uniref:Uncharacterized protein n=1 Tax=Phytophthora sojae (strain P6497) TaxID=1094619 RepID=G4YRE9_PHYSP|nr:hypothetical protein PHYSODRAFT_310586 [Phytophthora sojae]EGZ22883.1 hypothetical protein PHYSODRAFT_310586 [Phytophthora sojae]|eukprot:XP_009518171.1 hypothetical protein PHYSODRAFT_310586 [Phytophthora sojae]